MNKLSLSSHAVPPAGAFVPLGLPSSTVCPKDATRVDVRTLGTVEPKLVEDNEGKEKGP